MIARYYPDAFVYYEEILGMIGDVCADVEMGDQKFGLHVGLT